MDAVSLANDRGLFEECKFDLKVFYLGFLFLIKVLILHKINLYTEIYIDNYFPYSSVLHDQGNHDMSNFVWTLLKESIC